MLGRPRVNPDKTLWAPVAEKTWKRGSAKRKKMPINSLSDLTRPSNPSSHTNPLLFSQLPSRHFARLSAWHNMIWVPGESALPSAVFIVS